jgi:hypothetical protein
MCRSSVKVASSALTFVAILGCGAASQPIVAEPETARAEPKASTPQSWVEVRRDDERAADRAEPEVQAKIVSGHDAHEARHEPDRSPAAVLKGLTHPGVAFVVEYSLTDAYQRAADACTAQAGADEKKRSECPKKVRERFGADVIRFREDNDGRLWWMIYRRKGDDLVETHSTRIELDASTAPTVTMTTIGHGNGKRPLLKGLSRVELGVPNEYSIEIHDPELGHLVYDAKVGVVR